MKPDVATRRTRGVLEYPRLHERQMAPRGKYTDESESANVEAMYADETQYLVRIGY